MSSLDDAILPLVVGVTAHRDIPASEFPGLMERVRDLLIGLRTRYPSLPLLVLNPLAEGGDRLVARVARELEIPLFVPLPFAREEYERDFDTPESLAEFRTLISGAQVRELPLAPGVGADQILHRGEARNRQYGQLGMFVSSHCQLLLALWDGHPSDAHGGTAQVVDFHLYNTMPHMHPSQAAPNLLADDESDLVFHVGCSRQIATTPSPPPLAPLQARWLTAGHASPAEAGLPPQYGQVFQQMEAFNRDVARHWPAICARHPRLLPTSPPAPMPASAMQIERLFGAADGLATHFQRRVRGSLQATHLIAALMGLAFILYSDLESRAVFVLAFLALFALGFVLDRIGRHRQWHRKYLDYRGLAEGLRVQLYWRLAGADIPPDSSLGYDSFLQKQDVELSWIRHAMRGTSLYRDSAAASDPRWLGWVVAHWIGDKDGHGGQLDYFREGSIQRARAYRFTERLGALALAGGLSGAAVLLFADGRLSADGAQWLVLAMGLLPLVAGIREAYSFKKADKELIKQFQFMARTFESCRIRLARARNDAEVRGLLLALGRACLEEHAEWILLHRERPLQNQSPG